MDSQPPLHLHALVINSVCRELFEASAAFGGLSSLLFAFSPFAPRFQVCLPILCPQGHAFCIRCLAGPPHPLSCRKSVHQGLTHSCLRGEATLGKFQWLSCKGLSGHPRCRFPRLSNEHHRNKFSCMPICQMKKAELRGQ